MNQSVIQKIWFAVFNDKVTARVYIIKIWLFLLYLLSCWFICDQTWFDVHHYKSDRSVENWTAAFKVKVTAKVQNVGDCLSGWYLLNCRTFFCKIWHCDAALCARVSCGKKLVCYVQGQGHSKGSCDQNMTISIVSSELLIPWQPNMVWWYIIISQSVLWKKWMTAFKVKVRVNGQNVNVFPEVIF